MRVPVRLEPPEAGGLRQRRRVGRGDFVTHTFIHGRLVVLLAAAATLLAVGVAPSALAQDSGEPMLFSVDQRGDLIIHSLASGRTHDVASSGGSLIAIAPSGNHLASVGDDVRVLRAGGAATILDEDTNDRVVVWHRGTPAWSGASNEFVYAKGEYQSTIRELWLADTIENRVVQLEASLNDPDSFDNQPNRHYGGFDFHPSKRQVIATLNSETWPDPSEIVIFDLAAGTRETLRESEWNMGAIVWAPGGDVAAYFEMGSVRLVDTSSGAVTVLDEASDVEPETRPSWSPDGSLLAYFAGPQRDGPRPVVVVDRDGTRREVTRAENPHTPQVTWTSDRTIAFSDGNAVREVDLGGSARTLLTQGAPISSLTYAPNAASGWMPLVAQPRSIDDACPEADVEPAGFSDVGPTNVHKRAIDCVAWWKVSEGTSSGGYEPAGSVNRAQMATFISRAIIRSGGDLPSDPPDAFDDDNGGPHEKSINQLAAVGVVSGTGHRAYSPGRAVTRAQMATFLANAFEHRAERVLAAPRGDYFIDDQGNLHEDRINRVAEAGIAGGTGDRQYSPAATVRRDQMASFLARLLDLLVEETDAVPPS